MKRLLGFILIILFSSSCEQTEVKPDLPTNIKREIIKFSKDEMAQPTGASVSEYELQGQLVFVFCPGIIMYDTSSEVIDSQGNTLGYLGGFEGNAEINGEDFSNAVFIRIVWEN